jgi:hypothetical protein
MGIQTLPISSSLNGFMNEQRFTASGTYTPAQGVTKVWVQMIGGGGAGANRNNNSAPSAGSSGGLINEQVTVVPGTVYTATVGGGGAAVSGNNNGTAGTDTTVFGLTAVGGFGGTTLNGASAYARFYTPVSSTLVGRGTSTGYAATGVANTGTPGQPSGGTSGAGGSGIIIIKWLS